MDMPFQQFADDIGSATIRAAKQICATCPVRSDCLNEAMSNMDRTTWGVWGGFTTGERRRLAIGGRARLCLHCGTEYVYSRCFACAPDRKTILGILEDLHEEIAALNDEGCSDQEISNRMSVVIGQHITRKDVTNLRWRWNIPISQPLHNQHKPDTYDPTNVERTEMTTNGFKELTTRERVALMRRWLAKGLAPTHFGRTYGCNSHMSRDLSVKARDEEWVTEHEEVGR